MGHKSYTRFRPEPDATGVSFDLDGEHFDCVPRLPAGAVYDLGGMGSGTYRAIEFIAGCIDSEADAERFMAELRRRDLITDPELIDQLLRDLMAEYVPGRPSMPSAAGSDLPASTPTSS